jgi:hypothetical protein
MVTFSLVILLAHATAAAAQERGEMSDSVLATVVEGEEPTMAALSADAELGQHVDADDSVELHRPAVPRSRADAVFHWALGVGPHGLGMDYGIGGIGWLTPGVGMGGRVGELDETEQFDGRDATAQYAEVFVAVRNGDATSVGQVELGAAVARVEERDTETVCVDWFECEDRTLAARHTWNVMLTGGVSWRVFVLRHLVLELGYRGAAVPGVTAVHGVRAGIGFAI